MSILKWLKDNYNIQYNNEKILKFKPLDNNIPIGLEYLPIEILDLSDGNLTEIPKNIFPLFDKLKCIILDNNNIENIKIPINLNYNLELLSIKNNPINLINNEYTNLNDFFKEKKIDNNILDKNEDYIKNLLLKFNKNELDIDNNINFFMDFHDYHDFLNNNYDGCYYLLNNYINKILLKSIKFLLIDIDDNFIKNYVNSISFNSYISNLLSNNDKNNKNFYINILKNIILNDIYYDNNYLILLKNYKKNKIYDLYNESFLIKETFTDIYKNYEEYMIGILLTYKVNDYFPNFSTPISIYNLNEYESIKYPLEETMNNDYHLTDSQYYINKNYSKIIFTPSKLKNKNINNYLISRKFKSISLSEFIISLIENEIEIKKIYNIFSDIIVQVCRSLIYSFLKIKLVYYEPNIDNIYIEILDDYTYIKELFFISSQDINYEYHVSKNIVKFTNFSECKLNNKNENILNSIHIHYLVILKKLYKYYNQYKNKNIIEIIKIYYILIGSFFYKDKKNIKINTKDDIIIKIIESESKLINEKDINNFRIKKTIINHFYFWNNLLNNLIYINDYGYEIDFLVYKNEHIDIFYKKINNKILYLEKNIKNIDNTKNIEIYEKMINNKNIKILIDDKDIYYINNLLINQTKIIDLIIIEIENLLKTKKDIFYQKIINYVSNYIVNHKKLLYMYYIYYKDNNLNIYLLETNTICSLIKNALSIDNDLNNNYNKILKSYYGILFVNKYYNEKTKQIKYYENNITNMSIFNIGIENKKNIKFDKKEVKDIYPKINIKPPDEFYYINNLESVKNKIPEKLEKDKSSKIFVETLSPPIKLL